MITLSKNRPTDMVTALKYAYAFMQSKRLKIKECSFFNNNPKEFNKNFILPRDMYTAVYEGDGKLPEWEIFRDNLTHRNSAGYSCVASLDEADTKRVLLSYICLKGKDCFASDLIFNIYDEKYEKEALKAFEEIESAAKALK